MDTVVFAGISLLLLIPVIYFIPLSFTIKGKIVVIAAAFLTAVMALFGYKIYPLWLIGFFGIVLLFFITYLFGKNLNQFVLSTSNEEEEVNSNNQLHSSPFIKKSHMLTANDKKHGKKNDHNDQEVSMTLNDEYIIPVIDFNKETELTQPSHALEEKVNQNHSVELEKMDDLLEGREENMAEIRPFVTDSSSLSESKEIQELALFNAEVSATEESSMIEKQDKEEDWLEELELDKQTHQPITSEGSDLSEIERLLEEDFEIRELEDPQLNHTEASATEESSMIEEQDKEEGWLEELELDEQTHQPITLEGSDLSEIERILEEDMEIMGPEDPQLNHAEASATEESSMIEESDKEENWLEALEIDGGINSPLTLEGSDFSEIEQLLEENQEDMETEKKEELLLNNGVVEASEVFSSLEENGLEKLENKEETNKTLTFEDSASVDVQQLLVEDIRMKEMVGLKKEEPVYESASTLQPDLYKTMLMQIQLAKGEMDAEQYESFVKGYLHPDLGDQEYCTFAFCLIEHYIDEKKVIDLKEFLLVMKKRFSHYPILVQELDFIENYYVSK